MSRSIGDAHLKRAEFNKAPLLPKFRLPEPFEKPILRSEPSVWVHRLQPEDQFVIFASDGLWEHLSNQEAVDIINNHPRNVKKSHSCKVILHFEHGTRRIILTFGFIQKQGIARRLIKAALKVAVRKREITCSDLKKIDRGVRRHFHDDITVIVLFLDPLPMNRTSPLSVKGPQKV